MRSRGFLMTILALVVLVAVPMFARSKPAPTAPGKYKEWGQDIDEIEIVKSFRLADYDRIVVLPFDTSGTPLPDKKDKSYDTIKSALASYTFTLVEALKPELRSKATVEQLDKAPKTSKTLIVRGRVEAMSPGSRAKRYIAGYGAGAAGSKASGEIVDAKSGEVLARFSQERRSGGTFKFGGGSDLDVMRDSIHATGKDIAHILDAF
jgi:uncharacterized protein DUF4410